MPATSFTHQSVSPLCITGVTVEQHASSGVCAFASHLALARLQNAALSQPLPTRARRNRNQVAITYTTGGSQRQHQSQRARAASQARHLTARSHRAFDPQESSAKGEPLQVVGASLCCSCPASAAPLQGPSVTRRTSAADGAGTLAPRWRHHATAGGA